MKVYILLGCPDYEGDEIISVFKDKIKAEKEHMLKVNELSDWFDSYKIEEYEVR